MAYEFFVALRHLMSRERRALISVITGISVLGVVVGVTALIGVIAVMDGAQQDYFRKLIDQYAHLEIYAGDGFGGVKDMANYRQIMAFVEKDPEVLAASPVLRGYAMIKREAGFSRTHAFRPAQVFGIDAEAERRVSQLIDGDGREVMGKRVPGKREIVLGRILARQLGIAWPVRGTDGKVAKDAEGKEMWQWRQGVDVYAMTGKVAVTANNITPKQSRLRVVGIFHSGLFDVDRGVAYVSLHTFQQMNVLDDVVNLVHARLDDPYRAEDVKDRLFQGIRNQFGPGYLMRTWAQLNPEFFKALRLEKLGMFVILLLVVLVAGLNIIATLILVTMEKTREIGILRAMGASRRSIRRIFLFEGLFIGILGTGIGVVAGLILCYFLKYHFPIELPEAVYGLDGLPVQVRLTTVLIIMASSVVVCLLASVLPATQASRLDVVEALRYE